jgi:glycosyltransferase involved in cell wall biosynthesis
MIGLIGPGDRERCGVRDYVLALKQHLQNIIHVHYATYYSALSDEQISQCDGVILHYESAYFPDTKLLGQLNRKCNNRLYVVPHEVYREDPFAFPYAKLTGRFWIDLKCRQLLYKWRHLPYLREKRLQKAGYHARGVIPLSNVNCQILQEAGCPNLQTVIPHAFYASPETVITEKAILLQQLDIKLKNQDWIGGIFGFLSPSNDYKCPLDALCQMKNKPSLLISGGEKARDGQVERLQNAISTRGLEDFIRLTGFISEKQMSDFFSLCDFFVCPFRFRSNSGSLLRLLSLGKPVIAADIELTRELKSQGAPLYCYRSVEQLRVLMEKVVSGNLPKLDNRYAFDFNRVADMYVHRLLSD